MTVIRLPDRPFPTFWEQDPRADTCPHQWEDIYAESSPGDFVEVGRCCHCHTPRCDANGIRRGDQCVERRHHATVHIFPSGMFDPVGGYLRDEEPR